MLRFMRVRIWVVTVLGASSVFAACSRPPRARHVIAPDGSPALHVSCGSDQGACFELAGIECPNGYRVKPIFDTASNNFLVRCENRASVAQNGAASTVVIRALAPAPPAASPQPAAPGSAAAWPPPEQPWPPADPWAATGASSNGTPALPETARLPDGQIDIGY